MISLTYSFEASGLGRGEDGITNEEISGPWFDSIKERYSRLLSRGEFVNSSNLESGDLENILKEAAEEASFLGEALSGIGSGFENRNESWDTYTNRFSGLGDSLRSMLKGELFETRKNPVDDEGALKLDDIRALFSKLRSDLE